MSDETLTQPSRQMLHTRNVCCTGYLRSDGLFDIEGRLVDTKGIDTQMPYGVIEAGGVLHQMVICMTVDSRLQIHQVEASSEVTPTLFCTQVSDAYASLKGLLIGPGFKQQVAERVGGIQGCTHLTELLGPMAATAIQTIAPVLQRELRQRAG
ncbi:hypothetical protein D9M71_119860 [compost metagenome]